jgi:8-oxo-dGTP diphosphatase
MPSTAADSPIVNPGSIDEDYIHVVAAIIWEPGDSQRFLIAQRQKGKHLQDYWEFPGGKLELGESPRQALQRELQEEVNILLTRASPYMRVYYRYPERNILLDTWMVEEYRGDPVPGEQQLLRWIDLSQTDDYQFPPADIPIIEAIKSSAKAGIQRLP